MKTIIINTITVAILILLVVASCNGGSIPPLSQNQTDTPYITYWHDDERDVGCWIITQYNEGSGTKGLSCLPDSDIHNP